MFFNKIKFNIKKNAFSMVELMMLLLIASLVVAASVPIITKKHLHLPSSVNHGSYMCYYKDGHLMEARRSGRVNPKMLAGYPRETTRCIFDPPAKASLFQIIAIGGGGGGGDAGYTGITPSTYPNSDSELKPFGDNNTGLTTADLIKIGVSNTTAAINEVKSYMGHLWAFSEGADSGRSGTLYYTDISVGSEVQDCPIDQVKYKWETKTKSAPTSVVLCSGYTGKTTVYATAYGCYKTELDENNNPVTSKVGAYVTFGGQSATCSNTVNVYGCVYPEPRYYSCKIDKITGYNHHDAEYRSGTYQSGTKKIEVPCPNPCLSKNQKNCNSNKCYREEPVYSNCSNGIAACLVKAAYDEPIIQQVNGTCEYPCTNQKTGTKTTTWTENAPSDTSWGTISGEGITCKQETYDGTVEYEVQVRDGCKLSTTQLTTDTISYSKSYNRDSYSVGNGPFCTTDSIDGDLGLTYSTSNSVPSYNADEGEEINSSVSVSSPHSFCDDLGECGTSVGYDYSGTYAEASIGSNTIRANSAPKGATGNSLVRDSVTLDIFSSMTNSAINTISKTFYYDRVISDGSNGTNGTCSPASGNKYDCRRGSGERVGYCLQHYNTPESAAVENGVYKWKDTYDINTLTKGYDGNPGEFKTIVVRSLNGIDRTINVGRGGSAATLNLGKSGSSGSDTTFGTILIAKGGAGGAGSQAAPEATGRLPKFDKASMNFTKLKACFTTSDYDEDEQCLAWKSDPKAIPFYRNTSGSVGMTPTQNFLGGMFSFLFTHIGSTLSGTTNELLENAGRGGTGGGVQHFCWAGQNILYFEGQELYKSSVYNEDSAPANADENNIIPASCQTSYQNVSASSGYDGALIITW